MGLKWFPSSDCEQITEEDILICETNAKEKYDKYFIGVYSKATKKWYETYYHPMRYKRELSYIRRTMPQVVRWAYIHKNGVSGDE